jgi:hypothetical protein
MLDEPGQAATNHDTDFSLTIEEVAERYATAGHPRTFRTLQRYCASGHLDCRKAATTLGDKYFVTSQSVARHIAQIVELAGLQFGPAHRDKSRPDAIGRRPNLAEEEARQDAASRVVSHEISDDHERQNASSAPGADSRAASDMLRHLPVGEAILSRPVAQRESEIARLHDDINFLRNQIATKDEQIAARLERDKETNFLVRGHQQMLSPLLAGPQSSRQESETPVS